MKKLIFILWFILGAHWIMAQQPQSISVALCGATQRFCVDKNKPLNTACISIKIPAGTCPITKMDIDWDNDGSYDQALNVSIPKLTKDTSINVSHPYDLTNFIKSCRPEIRYFITVRSTFGTCSEKENLAPGIVIFNNPVTVTVKADSGCANQRVNLDVRLCPAEGAEFTIDYGDGTSGKETFKTYTQLGNYTITVSAQNGLCGVGPPASTQLAIIGAPLPAIADSGGVKTDKDTLVVCLDGGNIVRLDGKKGSLNVTSVRWSIVGPRGVTYLQGTNSRNDRPLVRFNEAGIYTITLIGENPCGLEVPSKKTVRVVNLPRPTLPRQNDTCQAFTYQITQPIAGGIYKLNGVVFNAAQGVAVNPDPTQPYVVELSVSGNECAPAPAVDTFFVRDTPLVKILGLQPENTYCAGGGTTRVELSASQPGVVWSPQNRITVTNGKTYLNVTQPGTFRVVARLGSGTCARADSVLVNVHSATAQAQNAVICRGTKEVVLKRNPGPGTWVIKNCGSCGITGDTLSVGSTAPDIIRLAFTAIAGGSCSSTPAEVEVRISQPLASHEPTSGPYCEGQVLKIKNNSTGASTFEWRLDGTLESKDRNLDYPLKAGTHTFQLRAIAGDCVDDTTFSLTVLPLPLLPSFTATPTEVCDGAMVTLSATGTPLSGVEYSYAYGNGQKSDGFQPTAQRYANKTTATQPFEIVATAKNGCGTQTKSEIVRVKPQPTARIGVDSSTVSCPPALITFTNGSLAHNTAETLVNFGDGTPAGKQTETIFKYRYDNRDTLIKIYRAIMTVRNECGLSSDTVAITVFPSVVKARFSVSNFKPCRDETIILRDASTPGVTKMQWSDGNGWQSVGRTASYPVKGTGKIRLYLRAEGCGFDTTSRVIDVQMPVPGSFKIDNGPICAGQQVLVKNTSDPQKIRQFEWRDSESTRDSSNFDFIKTYTKSGQYQLTLTVVSNEGCSATTAAQAITVQEKPSAGFSIVGDSIRCDGEAITLKATMADALRYEWTEGSMVIPAGETLELKRPPGIYGLGLKVSNGVCADSSYQVKAFTINECTLHIPDVFTPQNGDPINDFYSVFGKGISTIKTMRIYNRWGEQVFFKENFDANLPTLGWDGGDHPAGQYVLEVEAEYLGGASYKKQRAGFYLIRKQ